MVEFGDRLLWSEHRDRRDGQQPIGERRMRLGHVDVEGPGQCLAQLVVGEGGDGEAVGGVEEGDIDPHLGEPLVEKLRQHSGGPVDGVAGGETPPGSSGHAGLTPELEGHLAHCGAAMHHLVELDGNVGAGDVGDEIAHPRQVLDHVAVGVDHRVGQLGAHPGDAGAGIPHGWRR